MRFDTSGSSNSVSGFGIQGLVNQYARIRTSGVKGWKIAKALGYKRRIHLVELSVFTAGSSQPQYMMVSVRSVKALVPLGYNYHLGYLAVLCLTQVACLDIGHFYPLII
ncbi:hypothetical protein ABEX44_15365 [Priestia megaterium]